LIAGGGSIAMAIATGGSIAMAVAAHRPTAAAVRFSPRAKAGELKLAAAS